MIVFQDLVDRAFRNDPRVADALGVFFAHDHAGNADKGILQELLIGVAPILDLIFKPTHLLPPYSFATRSA